MNTPQIEAIRPEHIKDVLQLIKELAVYVRETDAVVIDEDLLQDVLFYQRLAYGGVAEEKGEVIGLAICYIRFPLGRATAIWRTSLSGSAPGKGIGSACWIRWFIMRKNRIGPACSGRYWIGISPLLISTSATALR